MQLKWLGHASFKIKTGTKVLYIDPYAGDDYDELADVILISHFHYDHCSIEKIRQVSSDSTAIFGTKEVAAELHACRTLTEGEPVTLDGTRITAVPAYSLNKKTHPKGFAVGFLLALEGKTIYFASDSDFIPEMRNVKADIVILPVGGTYTMGFKEAVQVVKYLKPKIAIPMHYDLTEGTSDDAELFMEFAESEETEVIILSEGREIEL